jgi:WD40 repeat protein
LRAEQAPAEEAPRAGSTDLFLSYSRRDRAFVEWLHDALRRRGKDVFVDWEDIPDWSPDYEATLEGAIRATGAFVFVVSPAAVESLNCRRELDVAVEAGKRIRPVLCRPIENEAIPPALRKPQWLDLLSRSEEAVEKLVATLDVDPEWVQAHTRLLVRAQEWEERGRDASVLLHASDLRAAERVLAEEEKDPPTTRLQSEFVLASRKEAARRQRLAFGAVIAALFVAVGLAIFAFVQRSRAIHDAKVARSRQLAAVSLGASSSDARRVLELALEANEEAETPEAEDALRAALVRSQEVGRVEGVTEDGASFLADRKGAVYVCPDGTVGRLLEGTSSRCARRADKRYGPAVFSVDGRYAFEVAVDRSLSRVVDTVTGAVVGTVPVGNGGAGNGSLVTPDGRRVLTVEHGRARLWVLPRRPGRANARWHQRNVGERPALSPDGRRFVTDDLDEVVRVWDTATTRPVAAFRDPRVSSPELRITNSGVVLAIAQDGVAIWSLDRPHSTLWVPDVLAAVSRDGRVLAFQRPSGRVEIRRAADPKKTVTTLRMTLGLMDVSPDGQELIGYGLGVIGVWSATTTERLGLFRNDATWFFRASLSPDGSFLLTQDLERSVRLWRVSPTPALASVETPGAYFDGKIAANGTHVAMSWSDSVRTVEWGRQRPTMEFRLRPAPREVVLSSDGKLAAAVNRNEIGVWRTRSGRRLWTVNAPGADGVAFSADGTRLAAGVRGGAIRVWNSSDGAELRVPKSAAALPGGAELVLSPTGNRLAVRADNWADATRVIDLDRLRRIPVRLPGGGDVVPTDVEFSADGTLVALSFDEVAIVYRTDNGRRVRALRAHAPELDQDEGRLSSVTFSPDGRLLMTRRDDDTLRVWNVATGKELYAVRASDEPMFSPDGAVFAADVERPNVFFGETPKSSAVIWSAASGRRLASVVGDVVGFSQGRLITTDGQTLRLFACDGCGSLDRLRTLAEHRLGKR